MQKELIKLDAPELQAIEKTRATEIKETFGPMALVLQEFEDRHTELLKQSKKGITPEISGKAKRLRLDVAKIRIETGKIKDKMKENIKLEDRAIMGVHNFIVLAVKNIEDSSKEIELHAERMEQKRKEELQKKRVELLSKYVDDAHERNLADMDGDVWEAYLSTKKKEYEDRIEAEKKAEAERIEAQRKQELYLKRKDTLIKERLVQFFDINELTTETTDLEFGRLLDTALQAKRKHEAEQERIRKDNERLEAERAAAEKIAAQERAKREQEIKAQQEKERKEREAYEAKLKKEREQREAAQRKAEAEKKALQDKLDQQERERKAKEADEKKAKEALLKKGDVGVWEQIESYLLEATNQQFNSEENREYHMKMIDIWDKQIKEIQSLK